MWELFSLSLSPPKQIGCARAFLLTRENRRRKHVTFRPLYTRARRSYIYSPFIAYARAWHALERRGEEKTTGWKKKKNEEKPIEWERKILSFIRCSLHLNMLERSCVNILWWISGKKKGRHDLADACEKALFFLSLLYRCDSD